MNLNNSRLRKIRIDKGFKQIEVCNALGITQAYYSQIERGERTPSLEIFIKLCNVLGITPNDLLDPNPLEPVRDTSQ